MKNMYWFSGLILLVSASLISCRETTPPRPNILFVLADDWSYLFSRDGIIFLDE